MGCSVGEIQFVCLVWLVVVCCTLLLDYRRKRCCRYFGGREEVKGPRRRRPGDERLYHTTATRSVVRALVYILEVFFRRRALK